MGAPLMLTKNRSHSLENNLSDENFGMLDNDRENTTVNGKLDINIKSNSNDENFGDKAQNNNIKYYHSSDNLARHNYH
jgi:hypothetical protein